MFSSNQKLIVTGDKNDDLKQTILFALFLRGNIKIKGYYIDSEAGMVLVSSDKIDGNTDLTLFKPEDVGNFDYLMNHIYLYLSSSTYKDLLRKVEKEQDDYLEYFDGSTNNGWEVGAWEEANKYKVKYPYDYRRILYIRPYLTAYSK